MTTRRTALAVAFLAAIILANIVTTRWGLVPIGFGMVTTAGTAFAGLTFALRDSIHDIAGWRATAILIVGGALLSVAISDPRIALASGVAFLLSEAADTAIYAPLRRRRRTRAALLSNLAGAVVDTFVFLHLAGFPMSAAPGQVAGKFAVTLPAVGLVAYLRRSRRAVEPAPV